MTLTIQVLFVVAMTTITCYFLFYLYWGVRIVEDRKRWLKVVEELERWQQERKEAREEFEKANQSLFPFWFSSIFPPTVATLVYFKAAEGDTWIYDEHGREMKLDRTYAEIVKDGRYSHVSSALAEHLLREVRMKEARETREKEGLELDGREV